MRHSRRQSGSALMMTVFVIALLSAVVMGILEMNTIDIQIMQNQVDAIQARMTAEAGLNDAVKRLRLGAIGWMGVPLWELSWTPDPYWSGAYFTQSFNGGTYKVMVDRSGITCTGTTDKGFKVTVSADYSALHESPYTIRLGALRINEDDVVSYSYH